MTHSIVGQSHLETGEEVDIVLILRSNIPLQSVDSDGLLARAEPASGCGIVGEDEDGEEGDKCGDSTLDDE